MEFFLNVFYILFGAVVAYFVYVYPFIYFSKRKKRKQEKAEELSRKIADEVNMNNPEISAVVDEAVEIVNSIIEASDAILCMKTRDYNGAILIYSSSENRKYYMEIRIMGSGDLRDDSVKNPYLVKELRDACSNMDSLLLRYRGYSSFEKDYGPGDFVFRTKRTATVPYNAQTAMNSLAIEQISRRCPGVDLSNGVIYDRKYHV